MLADLSPALLRDPRPAICAGMSRLLRLGGRTAVTVAPFVLTVIGGCLAVDGGFLADRDGEGDDVEELTPFVWMPGGTGRLALVGMTGGGTAVTETGAIAAVQSWTRLAPLASLLYPTQFARLQG